MTRSQLFSLAVICFVTIQRCSGTPMTSQLSKAEIKCPRISKFSNNIYTRLGYCFDKESTVGERCEFGCNQGYVLNKQQWIIECRPGETVSDPVGKWISEFSTEPPICIDVEKPKFSEQDRCDYGIRIQRNTEPNQYYAIVSFDSINITDNSGEPPVVTCETNGQPCKYEMGKTYEIDITKGINIDFKATDAANNAQLCRFEVVVHDGEKPTLIDCPHNIQIETEKQTELVTWKEPSYKDNCGKYSNFKDSCSLLKQRNCSLVIEKTHDPGYFNVNTKVEVEYAATDPSGNINYDCRFFVEITQKIPSCGKLNVPSNGLLAFVTFGIATMYCKAGGYYPDGQIPPFYLCTRGQGYRWVDMTNFQPVDRLPNCIKKSPPNGAQRIIVQSRTLTGDCNDEAVKKLVQLEVAESVGVPPFEVEYHCGENI